MLVVFFGYPIFLFMLMRMFLSIDAMKTTGQLLCNRGIPKGVMSSMDIHPIGTCFGKIFTAEVDFSAFVLVTVYFSKPRKKL